jgi:hypothetical protein
MDRPHEKASQLLDDRRSAIGSFGSSTRAMHTNDGERRSADTVTVAADTWRPLNAIAQTLANPFGIVIGAEDPDLVLRVT